MTNQRLELPVLRVDLVKAATRGEGVLSTLDNETLSVMQERYRKFLALCKKYPQRAIAPARDIDEMWHLHMLHPRAYYQDCMEFFGDILDHDGGFGGDSEEQFEELVDCFDETTNLWAEEFGEDYSNPESGYYQERADRLEMEPTSQAMIKCQYRKSDSNPAMIKCQYRKADSNPAMIKCLYRKADSNPAMIKCLYRKADSNPAMIKCLYRTKKINREAMVRCLFKSSKTS
ncbi:glycine-rich domain-containing protein [Brevibacillus dissolubilis]|uniref:glycine-rich domain-containing protein n=1 Tax=Brevibacillus dissolubilis TaxID=1844116 RepID=UPI00111795A7|nr:glycine-rich domain-containing protein-like [Brevibacillus dissolubilis]